MGELKHFIEHIWIKIKYSNVDNLYRPPHSLHQDFKNFEDKLINIFAHYDQILCFGNFHTHNDIINIIT